MSRQRRALYVCNWPWMYVTDILVTWVFLLALAMWVAFDDDWDEGLSELLSNTREVMR